MQPFRLKQLIRRFIRSFPGIVKKEAFLEAMAPKKATLRQAVEVEARQKNHVVPISTKGIQSITIPISLAHKLDERKLPQVRATLTEPHLPVKLGATKGVVHWKLDKTRLRRFTECEANPGYQRFFENQLAKADASGNGVD